LEERLARPYLRTFTGKLVDVSALKPEDINAYDIAWALSNCNRYAGHTSVPWDVLSHTGLVYMLYMQDLKGQIDPNYSLAIMLHDAAEAYIGDMIGGLKKTEVGRLFKELEDQIISVVFQRFGVQHVEWEVINRYDWQAAHIEINKFFPEVADHPGVTQAQYPLDRYPTLIKAKVTDFIEMLRHLAINAGAPDVGGLFSIPENLLASIQAISAEAQAGRSGEWAGISIADNRDVEDLRI
jgi:hypothetical protein